jgi:hypothetical protein
VFSELFDNNSFNKMQRMDPQGYWQDTVGHYDDIHNSGWKRRRQMFLESIAVKKDVFTDSDICLVGAVCSDFQAMDLRKRPTIM